MKEDFANHEDEENSHSSNLGVNNIEGTSFWESLQKELNNITIGSEEFDDGAVGQRENSKINIEVRQSKVHFLNGEKYFDLNIELFDLVQEYNQNDSNWKYDIIGTESMQYGIYSDGGHYDWHIDNYPRPIPITTRRSLSGNSTIMVNRKISVTIFLNDPDEYEGGELDIETDGPRADPRYNTYKLSKGSIVVFPSNRWHRVRPVTSGVRKSLVAWVFGPPFK
tara:strand:+ start:116 stop:784 length:669 start_codon:yes stop_codon:yes gene_type:complete